MLCSNNKIIIGVTTDALLAKKAYAEFLEPYEVRKDNVIKFCRRVNPHLFESESERVHLVGLSDPIGPTGTDPDLQALILTREVEKGGIMINNARA
jgi:pantetheine-phosphate adenylyltransferase